jgi:hypothetical protein
VNTERRKHVADVIVKARELAAEIDQIRDDEQDYLDHMPENMRQGEKGLAAEESASQLEEAVDGMESAVYALEQIQ